jgi:hypothetical protein
MYMIVNNIRMWAGVDNILSETKLEEQEQK